MKYMLYNEENSKHIFGGIKMKTKDIVNSTIFALSAVASLGVSIWFRKTIGKQCEQILREEKARQAEEKES